MKPITLTAIILTALFAEKINVSAQNLVLNGNFTANASSFSSGVGQVLASPNPAITDWTATQPGGNDVGLNGTDTTGASTQNGQTYLSLERYTPEELVDGSEIAISVPATVWLGDTAYISQTGISLAADTTYTLSCYVAESTFNQSANTGSLTLVGTITDASLTTTTIPDTTASPNNGYTFFSDTFTTGAADNDTITFKNVSGGTQLIKDVSLEAVPEPASYAIFSLGTLVLLLTVRRSVKV